MLSKFFKHGSGVAKNAIQYLLGKDGQRENAIVQRGDPVAIASLIDSTNQKKRYTSGVLSFSQSISQEEKDQAMRAYEYFLSGGDAVELSTLWVEHTEHNRTELHFIVANIDLKSGRAYTPYVDKLDFNARDALDDFLNTVIKDADPDDPARKRDSATIVDDILKRSKSQKELIGKAEELLLNQIQEAVLGGSEWSQDDTVSFLKSMGFEISRRNAKTISVKHPDLAKNIRLKGAVYEQATIFSRSYFAERERTATSYEADNGARAREAEERFKTAMQYRHDRVSERYSKSQERFLRQYQASDSKHKPIVSRLDTERQPIDKRNQREHQNLRQDDSMDASFSSSPFDSTSLLARGGDSSTSPRTAKPKKRKDEIRNANQAVQREPVLDRKDEQRGFSDFTPFSEIHGLLQERKNYENSLQIRVIDCFFKEKKIGEVIDKGDKLLANGFKTAKSSAYNIVMEGRKKGWQAMEFSGTDAFLKHSFTYALRLGVQVVAKDDKQRKILKEVQEDERIRKNAVRAIADADAKNQRFGAKIDSVGASIERLKQQQSDFVEESKGFTFTTQRLASKMNQQMTRPGQTTTKTPSFGR